MTRKGNETQVPPRHRAALPVLVVLLVLLGATTAATALTAASVEDDSGAELKQRSDAAIEAIDRRVAAYTELLFGTRALFESLRPSRQAFRAHARSLLIAARFSGMRAISFADKVEDFERRRYVADVRRDASRSEGRYPRGFRIKPPGVRPRHVVVSYLEPVERNAAAFGLDLLAEARRAAAVERTERTGRPAATPPIRLVIEPGRRRSFLLLLALRNAAGPLTDSRTGRFEGVVVGAVQMGDFIADALPERDSFELEVYDVGPVSAPRPLRPSRAGLMHDGDGRLDAVASDGGAGRLAHLDVAGRRWAVYYRPHEPLLSGAATRAPLITAGVGVALSLLAAALLYSLASRRERAEAIAAEMTADLRRSREHLKRSNAELEQFAYVASHDLNEPLRVIAGFVRLLQKRYGGKLDADADRFIDAAVGGAKRMQAMIDALLAYSRVGRSSVSRADVDCSAVADEAVAALRPLIEERHAEVRVGELPSVPGEPAMLGQLFQNLLSNAVKFGDREDPRVEVSAARVNGAWRFSVEDNGDGVAPRQAERIFEMFQRLHDRSHPGTGIGLAICKRIVEKHGGHIWVEPAGDGGSAFRFTIPAEGPRA